MIENKYTATELFRRVICSKILFTESESSWNDIQGQSGLR